MSQKCPSLPLGVKAGSEAADETRAGDGVGASNWTESQSAAGNGAAVGA